MAEKVDYFTEPEWNWRHCFSDSMVASTVRWIRMYSHCYSKCCSLICLPLWIVLLPVAFLLDLLVYPVVAIAFLLAWIVCVLAFPFQCGRRRKSFFDFCYRNALTFADTTFYALHAFWWCYCGSGERDDGIPICAVYFCSRRCHETCHRATQMNISAQHCVLL